MDASRLQRMLQKHGTLYTNSEVIICAFNLTEEPACWDDWFGRIVSELGSEAANKLGLAAATILKDFAPDDEGFGYGCVTPEASLSYEVLTSQMVPRAFLEFLVKRGGQS